jgi:hypothetical protein
VLFDVCTCVTRQHDANAQVGQLTASVAVLQAAASDAEARLSASEKERKAAQRKLTTATERIKVLEEETTFTKQLNDTLQANTLSWQKKVRASALRVVAFRD